MSYSPSGFGLAWPTAWVRPSPPDLPYTPAAAKCPWSAVTIGLDLTLAIHEYVLPQIDARPAPSPLLRELVESGDLGMKTGRGFRDWAPDSARATGDRLFDHLLAATGAAS